MREFTALVMNGFSEEFALNLDRPERLAFLVIIGEQNGRTFDWKTNKWEDPDG